MILTWEFRFPALGYRKMSAPRKGQAKKRAIEMAKARRVGEPPVDRIEVEYESQEETFVVRGLIEERS